MPPNWLFDAGTIFLQDIQLLRARLHEPSSSRVLRLLALDSAQLVMVNVNISTDCGSVAGYQALRDRLGQVRSRLGDVQGGLGDAEGFQSFSKLQIASSDAHEGRCASVYPALPSGSPSGRGGLSRMAPISSACSPACRASRRATVPSSYHS